MECKNTVVIDNRWVVAICYTRHDYYHGIPWRELLNPLRYSFSIKRRKGWINFNPEGQLQIRLSNWLYQKRKSQQKAKE